MKVLFLLVAGWVFASPTICLNMIVRNESHVIRNCLASVKDQIDYWVIVDTGSNDGTQKIIQECLANVPGELHERPWVDFAHNRTEAIVLAKGKCDYIFTIDADEELVFEPGFDMSKLDQDCYQFVIRRGDGFIDYKRILLVNDRLNWHYEGILHERIMSDEAKTCGGMPGAVVMSYTNGFRSKDPDKYKKDAAILEKALETDPTNARYMYYLAQSYLNIPDYPKAIDAYKKRATMGGWEEEIYFSLYQIATLQQEIFQLPDDVLIKSYHDAYQFRASRIEPLFRIAKIYMQQKNFALAFIVLDYALAIPMTEDSVFVETWIYDWGLLATYADCASHLGLKQKTLSSIQALIEKKTLPQEIRDQLIDYVKTNEDNLR